MRCDDFLLITSGAKQDRQACEAVSKDSAEQIVIAFSHEDQDNAANMRKQMNPLLLYRYLNKSDYVRTYFAEAENIVILIARNNKKECALAIYPMLPSDLKAIADAEPIFEEARRLEAIQNSNERDKHGRLVHGLRNVEVKRKHKHKH